MNVAPTLRFSMFFGIATLAFLSVFPGLNRAALGQFNPQEPRPHEPISYSSENPDWLAFVVGESKSNNKSWWPSWKLPNWKKPGATAWWSSEKKSSSYSRSNKTTMQKVSQTSKRWWNNTLEFLDPYAPPKDRPNSSRSEPGFFGKLFGGDSAEPKFNSVPEWASQPMPK